MTAILARDQLLSPEEYLETEENSPFKREFLNGVIFAMAGASLPHNKVTSNLQGQLFGRTRGGPCHTYGSDLKVRVSHGSDLRFYYPDVQIACTPTPGEQVYEEAPVVVVEVISESTRRIDQGEKMMAYLQLPSLQLYLLVETASPLVIGYRRLADGFQREVYAGLESVIPLPFLQTELPLAEIYERIDFSADPEE